MILAAFCPGYIRDIVSTMAHTYTELYAATIKGTADIRMMPCTVMTSMTYRIL